MSATAAREGRAYTAQEQANIAHVRAMIREVLDALDPEAVERFIVPGYIQHNQMVGQGSEPLKRFLREAKVHSPEPVHDIKRIFADGDHVIVHYHLRRWPGDTGYAIVDIFRLEETMVVEHWDVMMEVPGDSPNPVGPF
ncbi:nuclear transport factor 2 family protein [Novosphingobium sp. 1949]|uniref:Nuclear transport factor 2 family protein n=1 Tax=Novosphingobium organovorum TaxID=2930092 RepID=A0ABT0B9Q9_9SPHN|nr:nuclear transport factor 2 family protein [Novosphingobium organovorum]MCJ2181792.1 nuclear transport factor 2 family protein [Novosphingobium organovorum]